MKRLFFSLLLVLFLAPAYAQQNHSSADIYLNLRKLGVVGSVLYVAAHPDDENTRLLTWLSKERLYRTGYLSLTRGDGGQNLIGDEQGVELGLIRTQELLAARRIDGAEQFFTRAYDFGFSKSPQETFTKWDRDKILADVVWVIRKFQPDVIITRFPTTGEGGHGHHTASAILANEAFAAAADPARFPEQLKWVQPWQAKRILWNTFNFGGNNTTRPDQFTVDVGGYNAVLGKSYGEIAAESRSQHKSQGFGVPLSRGEALEFFSLTGGSPLKTDLLEDVNTTWNRVSGGAVIGQQVNNLIGNFDFVQPQLSVPALVVLHRSLAALPASAWQAQKLKEVQQLIEQCSGLFLEATTQVPFVAQTDSLPVNFLVNNRLGANLQLKKVTVDRFDSTLNAALPKNRNLAFRKTIFVPATKPPTQPYWLQEQKQEGYFVVPDTLMIGRPDVAPSFTAQFTMDVEGLAFTFEKPVRYKFTDPVKGELQQPLVVTPAVNVSIHPGMIIFKKNSKESKSYTIQAIANKKMEAQPVSVVARSMATQIQRPDTLQQVAKGNNLQYEFSIPGTAVRREKDLILPMVKLDTAAAANYLAQRTIRYDHIPDINYFFASGATVLNLDLQTVGKKIGYIVGAGDKVPEALEEMGYEVTLLTDKELARNSLQQFDAIISGVRAYNTNAWLNNYHDKLMRYVQNGGNLIVQYNTSNQVGPVRAKIGPFPFNISRNRITDENAAVQFLKPEHAVLNYPNKITAADFSGWVQERSIYHAAAWDKAFEPIISMSDDGEQPDAGSLVVARYGKGYFSYTGLVFFRQLPAGVPGAYRLMANLIALNKKKEF